MDFASLSRLINRMSPAQDGPFTTWIRRSLPLAVLIMLVTGCTTLPDGSKALTTSAARLKAAVPPSYQVAKSGGQEIKCRIQMIDGVMVADSDRMLPGHHRLVVSFDGTPEAYAADVDLVIPAPKAYQLMAEKENDTFTLSLVEQETAKIVATSSAPIEPLMRFQVFVIQK
jgi:hypothetical protein